VRGLVAAALVLFVFPTSTAAQAQPPPSVYRVGFLTAAPLPDLFEAFRRGLRELGWTEGQNLVVEYRSSGSRIEKVPELAAELVKSKVDVVVVTATAVYEARKALASVSTVFVIADDPVSTGLVASLARPGGRMTGLTSLNVELDAKRLEILKVALPGVRRVGILSITHDRARRERIAAAERGARSLGLQLTILEALSPDLLGAFDGAARARVGALMVLGSPPLRASSPQIAALSTKARVPTISAWREFPEVGGLMSYGASVPAMFRRAASYVDRILKGANPSELPIEQATTFELVVNLKTARALGLVIPPALLAGADQVID
jgi:putative tryptophan/tyrosine transport system substrate-binding protein